MLFFIGSWLERFDSEYSPLIPGPLDPDNSSASLEQWTWDQEARFQ